MGSNIRKGDTGALNPPVYGDAAQWPVAVAKRDAACGADRAREATAASILAQCSIQNSKNVKIIWTRYLIVSAKRDE
jgi:hypothetical protein